MLKKVLIITIILSFFMLLTNVAADVTIVKPYYETLSTDSEERVFDVGMMSFGQEMELVFRPESEISDYLWESLTFVSVPEGWKYENSKVVGTTYVMYLTSPLSAKEGAYSIKVVAKEEQRHIDDEEFEIRINLVKDLVDASLVDNDTEIVFGEKAKYTILLNNNSSTDAHIEIASNLPLNWFEGETVLVQAKSQKKVELYVQPKEIGYQDIEFVVKSADYFEDIATIKVPTLRVNPTLESKYKVASQGFNLLSPTMNFFYALVDILYSIIFMILSSINQFIFGVPL